MKADPYHTPVLLHAAINGLITDPSGFYVDVTFGGGGHSQAILKKLNNGMLMALDQDSDAVDNSIDDKRFLLIRQNFRNIENILEANSYGLPIGVLADLGVSSFQFDNAKRGFSFRFDNDLDMRMNKDSSLSAYDLLNNYQEKELENLFTTFGDFKTVESKRLAKSIVAARSNGLLKTTFQLVSSIESLVPQKIRNQFLARVFQAIRIEVNQELTALVDFLNQLPRILKKEGVVSIITYHSLEDRLVKNFFRTGNCNGVLEKDFYGNTSKPFLAINKKPIIPESEEIKMNPRSRSAKLRIAKRI